MGRTLLHPLAALTGTSSCCPPPTPSCPRGGPRAPGGRAGRLRAGLFPLGEAWGGGTAAPAGHGRLFCRAQWLQQIEETESALQRKMADLESEKVGGRPGGQPPPAAAQP